jgi:serine/threonine-protein kinase
MGEVYLARHRHIGRDAAIKVLLPEMSSNQEVVARFFNEARSTAAIRHPGIVEILDCDVHPSGHVYIVMELLEGEDLGQRLTRAGSFAADIPTAAAILAQVANAVGAAHAKGIVHRDLKPDNVFLCPPATADGVPLVKILDFGIAKLMAGDAQGHNRTRTGHLLGTPAYMSPEQCRGSVSIDHRTDIYALGCMAFEIVSGQPPFVRDGAGEVVVAHLMVEPPALSSLVPSVPPELDTLIARMLEKDPGARPQSMGDVLAQVESLLGSFSVPGPRLTAPVQPISDPPSPPVGGTPPLGSAVPSPGSGPVVSGRVLAGNTLIRPANHTTLSEVASEARHSRSGRDAGQDQHRWRSARPRWLVPAIVAGSVAAAAVVALLATGSDPGRSSSAPLPVARPPAPEPPVHQLAAPPPAPRPAPVPAAAATAPPPVQIIIELSSRPEGAEVFVAGEKASRGRTPLELALSRERPSPLRVTLRAPGYEDTPVSLDPSRQESGRVTVTMHKIKRQRSSGGASPSPRRGKWVAPADENDIYKPMGE